MLVGHRRCSRPRWNRLVFDQGWNDVVQKALPTFMGVFACGMLAALWVETAAAPRRARPDGARDDASSRSRARRSSSATRSGWRRRTTSAGGAAPLRDLPAAAGFALRDRGGRRRPRARCCTGSPGGRSRAPGVVSYGLYLWHLPILLAVRSAGLLPEPFVPRLAVVLALSFLAAWLSWRLVERPAIAWSHRRVGGARTAAPAARPGRRPPPASATVDRLRAAARRRAAVTPFEAIRDDRVGRPDAARVIPVIAVDELVACRARTSGWA